MYYQLLITLKIQKTILIIKDNVFFFYIYLILYYRPDCEKYYSFTELASQLNEPEEGVAITDSRLRPDQRLMENGLWDEANTEKLRLEEKQRTVRRSRENDAEKSAEQG